MHSSGTRLEYAVHQTLPSLAEVGLACETNEVPERFGKTKSMGEIIRAGAGEGVEVARVAIHQLTLPEICIARADMTRNH